jgi:CelD/BcsL family acetyltransferase involved in cellulose biosynthesis
VHETRSEELTVQQLEGARVLETLGAELDDLLSAVDAPITFRRPWLSDWVECAGTHRPWVVAIWGGAGRLEAAALLAVRRRGLLDTIVIIGHGPSDYLRLPARNPMSSSVLARALAEVLGERRRPWTVQLDQLPLDDPVALALAERLPAASLTEGESSPVTRFGEARVLTSHTNSKFRRNASQKRRRLEAEGVRMEFHFVRDPGEIRELVPRLESVRRRRDTDTGRLSFLDTRAGSAFYRSVIADLADIAEVQVAFLALNGQIAAYDVGLIDGHSYRSWDSRLDPAWATSSPGMILEVEILERLLADPTIHEFDRMRGLEPHKLHTTNTLVPASQLRAWSSAVVRMADEGSRSAKARLKQSPWVAQGWARAKRGRQLRAGA